MLSNDTMTDSGDGTKIIAMASLGLGSFLSGILPAAISERNRRRFPLSTSLMLCFGAGILLATALVHMLPDVRKTMPNNAEVYFCGGFFIVYFIDEFIHYFFGEAIQHSHNERTPLSHDRGHQHNHNQHSHQNYGSNDESAPLIQSTVSNGLDEAQQDCEVVIRQANERMCHTSHQEPCAQSMTGTIGLLVALSLHSFVEGLAIGVQDSSAKVLFLLGAVACHKLVMGFCLGLEFRSNSGASFRSQLVAVLIFSLGSVIGIGIGMAIVDLPSSLSNWSLPIIQALAGGTLLYVTVCEVMPREKARWHQNRERRLAGLAQFLAVGLGFAVMTIINYFIGDD